MRFETEFACINSKRWKMKTQGKVNKTIMHFKFATHFTFLISAWGMPV